MIPCSVLLEGEYGLNDLCIGVPCIIGAQGIESIVDVNLNEEEKALLNASAEKVRAMNAALNDIL
jgi:malate dehydrogenase